jgi:hypothetical protein
LESEGRGFETRLDPAFRSVPIDTYDLTFDGEIRPIVEMQLQLVCSSAHLYQNLTDQERQIDVDG